MAGTGKASLRMLWFTAITNVERHSDTRSESYLDGVRALVLSGIQNAPSLVPVVILKSNLLSRVP